MFHIKEIDEGVGRDSREFFAIFMSGSLKIILYFFIYCMLVLKF